MAGIFARYFSTKNRTPCRLKIGTIDFIEFFGCGGGYLFPPPPTITPREKAESALTSSASYLNRVTDMRNLPHLDDEQFGRWLVKSNLDNTNGKSVHPGEQQAAMWAAPDPFTVLYAKTRKIDLSGKFTLSTSRELNAR
ncbi:MAG: hypothetical protein M9945_05095 [Aquamicrobium sp.]|uniref:hypothetical protein n=1 Tax=Aquamicrobium sp. TaxID=1872579 RepID=UPI00349ECDF6|nr:hypothetical protein [Aquamicrobium sp.]